MIKDKLKKILSNRILNRMILSVLAFVGVVLQEIIPVYNPISWLIFLVIFMYFNNINVYNKQFFKSSVFFSFIFTFSLILGKIVYANVEVPNISVWKELIRINNIFSYIGIFILIYSILINILPKIYKVNIKQTETKSNSIKVFIFSFLVIFLCWTPYFLSLYPGELSVDSLSEMGIIVNNFSDMTNHHPMIHVLFVAIPYKLGMSIFHNPNMAVSCSSITQMTILALIFSYLICFLSKKKVNRLVLGICVAYFALIPMHGYYSVTMWKDVIFSGLMLLLTIKIIDICDCKKDLKFKNMIPFIIVSIFTIFFRNNALYMFFILLIFMLIIMRKYYKIILQSFFIIFLIYYSVTGPLFNALDIERSSSSEYIAMPLQQLARMAYKDVKFTKEEEKMLDQLMGVEHMKNNYVPQCSDGIKFNKHYKKSAFDKNKSKYLKLWLTLVIKHPSVAVEAYAVSTLGYWYPGVNNWAVYNGVYKNNYDIYRNPKGLSIIRKYVDKIESRNVPILNMLWSTSLAFWIICIFAFICIKRKGIKYILPYIPVFGIWVTMMIASPVYAEFRYIYSSYTCLPLLIILPLINTSIKKTKRNSRRNK